MSTAFLVFPLATLASGIVVTADLKDPNSIPEHGFHGFKGSNAEQLLLARRGGSRGFGSSRRSGGGYSGRRRGSRYDRDGDGIPCERGCRGGYSGGSFSTYTPPEPLRPRSLPSTFTPSSGSYGRIGGSNWSRPSLNPRTFGTPGRRVGQLGTLGGRRVRWNGTSWIPATGSSHPSSAQSIYRPIRAEGTTAILGGRRVRWNGSSWASANSYNASTGFNGFATPYRRRGQLAYLGGRRVSWSGSTWLPVPMVIPSTSSPYSYPPVSTVAGQQEGAAGSANDPIQEFMVSEGFPNGRPGLTAGYILNPCQGGRLDVSNVRWFVKQEYDTKIRWERNVCSRSGKASL